MKAWVYVALGLVGVAVAVLSGLFYVDKVQEQTLQVERENDRKWCALLDPLDDAYQSTQPATPLAGKVRDAIHQLRIDLGCV